MNLRYVWACVPEYVHGEVNGSMLYFSSDKFEYDHRVETCEEHLAREFNIDLKLLKKNSGKIVGKEKYMPIPFSREAVFIQFRHRHPDYKDDGAYGIVRVNAIQKIIPDGKHAVIVLKNEVEIYSMTSVKKLKEYLRDARKVVLLIPHLEWNIDEFHEIIFEEMITNYRKRKDEWI